MTPRPTTASCRWVGTGQRWDNALAESFFATLKLGLIGGRPWPSRAAARSAIFEWIEAWYKIRRLHSSLGYRSPAKYETVLAARPPHRGCPSKRSKLSAAVRAAGLRPDASAGRGNTHRWHARLITTAPRNPEVTRPRHRPPPGRHAGTCRVGPVSGGSALRPPSRIPPPVGRPG
ncbi:integrase core domain-containing protein [Kitasatospora sp. NBC_00374]|uniref:integrase core domain-containing protein n=1 Tax=Kitasatospora sp. NBC_00374 TaxID=2975964 RepID=UPI00352E61FE